MGENTFNWKFEKNQENFIYDTLKSLSESLLSESDGIFHPVVTIADMSDSTRTYTFQIRVPELSGFTWALFEVNTKRKTRNSEVTFLSSVYGAQSFKILSNENFIETINKIIGEKEVQIVLSDYYNRVIIKRKQLEDFKN